METLQGSGVPQVGQREALKVNFNKPFSLPANINLDPDNTDYVQGLIATEGDYGTVVDVVDFEVVDSHVLGGVEIWSLHSSFDERDTKVRRPAGPTGPYSFAIDLQDLAYFDIEGGNISGEVIYKDRVFSSPIEDESMDENGLWSAYVQNWTEHATGEPAEVVFGRQDIPSVQFTIRRPDTDTTATDSI